MTCLLFVHGACDSDAAAVTAGASASAAARTKVNERMVERWKRVWDEAGRGERETMVRGMEDRLPRETREAKREERMRRRSERSGQGTKRRRDERRQRSRSVRSPPRSYGSCGSSRRSSTPSTRLCTARDSCEARRSENDALKVLISMPMPRTLLSSRSKEGSSVRSREQGCNDSESSER